jgi:hypothetical protein
MLALLNPKDRRSTLNRAAPLTETETDHAVAHMRGCIEQYAPKYNEAKYPPSTYEDLRRIFGRPHGVSDNDIRTAVLWKFGHLGKSRIPNSHEELISSLQQAWPFCATLTGPAAEVFGQLKDAIGRRGGFRHSSVLSASPAAKRGPNYRPTQFPCDERLL